MKSKKNGNKPFASNSLKISGMNTEYTECILRSKSEKDDLV